MKQARTAKRAIIPVAIVLVLCAGFFAAALAGINVLYFLREQLGSPLAQPTATATVTAEPTSTATPAPFCGGPPVMFILLIGTDSRADSYSAGLADSIRIVRVDFLEPGVTHLAFQRDFYVEIPGISAHGGITHGKLNQAYLYGSPSFNYSDYPGEGPGLLGVTLSHNFGAQVDHYVAVNLQAFARIVDQLGGLGINLPYVVDGRAARSTDPDKYFPAGPQHLNGYRTMLLARMRPNGDLERSRTQNLILQALAAKMLTPANIPTLPSLAASLLGSVQTDLDPATVSSLICLGAMMTPDDVQAFTFPDELLTGTRIQDPVLGNTFIWDVDFNLLRDYVRRFNEGTWTETDPAGTPTPTP